MSMRWKLVLAVVELVSLAVGCSAIQSPQPMTLPAMPLQALGDALRRLSLSGHAGNAAAWFIFVLLGTLPLLITGALALRPGHRGKLLPLDGVMAALLSGMLCLSLYAAVNPQTLNLPQDIPASRAAALTLLGTACLSVGAAWAVLRLLHDIRTEKDEVFSRWLLPLIGAALLLYAAAFGVKMPQVGYATREAIARYAPEQMAAQVTLIALRGFTDVLPDALTAWVLLMCMEALRSLDADHRPTQTTLRLCDSLTQLSRQSIAAVTISHVAVNVLSAALLPVLHQAQATLALPILPLTLMLFALMLCRLLRRNKALGDENALFV